MQHFNVNETSGELRFELEAAFGADAELVDLSDELENLDPVTPTEYPMADLLNEGDHVVIGSFRHDDIITSGTITEMNSYSFRLDLDEDATGLSYFGFDDFGGKYGLRRRLAELNGVVDPDVDYGKDN